jgi:hypothetical protein
MAKFEDLDPDSPAPDIFIVPPGRSQEKKTHCGNCIYFTCGDECYARWVEEPAVKAHVERIKMLIKFTGLRLPEFDDGKAALWVAKMMGKGYTQEHAMLQLEIEKIEAAKKMVAPLDPVWADMRLKDVLAVVRGLSTHQMGFCTGKGTNNDGAEIPNGSPLYAAFHCPKWSGAVGWSLAHDPDRKLDPLPAELTAIADSKATSK